MPKTTRSFRYQRRELSDVKAQADYRGGGFDDFILPKYKKVKTKDQKNVYRILPPTWQGAKHWGYKIWLNYSIGPDNNAYLSLSKMKGEPDPIAEARLLADREGDDKLSKALAPKERMLVWVIDRDAEEDGPMIWPMPISVNADVSQLSYDIDTREISYIDDPDEGFDLRWYKTGQGLNTEYDPLKMKLLGPKPIHEDEEQQQKWLEYISENPLPECLQFYSYKHISGIFNGAPATKTGPDEDPPFETNVKPKRAATDDVETPAPRRTRPKLTNGDDGDEHPYDDSEQVKPRRVRSDDDETDASPKRESIQERIARRRREAEASADED